MRKIEIAMCNTIQARSNWASGNTTVCTTDGETLVTLHGHLIARITDTHCTLFDAGWQTVTTKSRLNAIARCLGVQGVYQKDFTWYFDDGRLFENGVPQLLLAH